MQFSRNLKRVHNILGLVIGLPILFWTVSGLFFTLFPIEQVRGANLRTPINHGQLALSRVDISADEAARRLDGRPTVKSAELDMFFGEPVWRLEARDGRYMVSAVSGELRSPISAVDASRIAREGIKPRTSTAGEPRLLTESPPREYGGPLPAWVVDYDPGSMRIYIDANSGELVTVRTPLWRTFDVLWRFHILDVTGGDRFDTWWLKLASFLALGMVLTGIYLVIRRLLRGKILQ